MHRYESRRDIVLLSLLQDETQESLDDSIVRFALTHHIELPSRRTGIPSVLNSLDQGLLGSIELLIPADVSVAICVNREKSYAVVEAPRLIVKGITDIAHADTVGIVSHLTHNARVAIHARAKQVLLMGLQPGGKGLGSPTSVAACIDIDRRLIVKARHLAPGFDAS